MYKFRKLNLDPQKLDAEAIGHYVEIVKLITIYRHNLFDDFVKTPLSEHVLSLVQRTFPYFWVILTKADGRFCGFIYLYDFVGDEKCAHSACVTVCLKKSFWGRAARDIGRAFTGFCFAKMGLKKLRAECFASNTLTGKVLCDLKFKKEGVLKGETLVNGRSEDLVLWGMRKPVPGWQRCEAVTHSTTMAT